MLVLTRKLMERLYIGDDICITVVRIEGGQVRLGIDAPRDVSVVRSELVPERPAPRFRAAHPAHAVSAGPDHRSDYRSDPRAEPAPVRYSPYAVRETDIRRRGRSR